MTRLFWRLVHLLPWRFTRHVCDLCDEFPDDPRNIRRDWFDDDTLTEPEIREHLAEEGWEPVTALPVPMGWRCSHVDITGSSTTGGILPTRPNVWCGCTMQPIYQAGNH